MKRYKNLSKIFNDDGFWKKICWREYKEKELPNEYKTYKEYIKEGFVFFNMVHVKN